MSAQVIALVALLVVIAIAAVASAMKSARIAREALAAAAAAKRASSASASAKKVRASVPDPSPAAKSPQPAKSPPPAPPEPSAAPAALSTPSGPTPSGTKLAVAAPLPPLPKFEDIEDEEVDATRLGPASGGAVPVELIVVDSAASVDEPTSPGTFFILAASAQTDKGLKRKRNEDSVLVLPDWDVYVVADGMGGYRGGELASQIAVETIESAYRTEKFFGIPHVALPRRASELARTIQSANDAVRARADLDPGLKGMGTTVCAARFARNKRRVYVAHVGDSRMYRLRMGVFKQMTSDHTMADLGVEGKSAAYLSRAVGVWPAVKVDILIGEPLPGDRYLLCSDGLTKMLTDQELEGIISSDDSTVEELVDRLIARANEKGGRDNVTVILMQILANEPNGDVTTPGRAGDLTVPGRPVLD